MPSGWDRIPCGERPRQAPLCSLRSRHSGCFLKRIMGDPVRSSRTIRQPASTDWP